MRNVGRTGDLWGHSGNGPHVVVRASATFAVNPFVFASPDAC
jgi:hypothetical protein